MRRVGRADRRRRRLVPWLVIVPVLVLFSSNLVANAIASRSSIEAKAGALIPSGKNGRAAGLLVKFEHGRHAGVGSRVRSLFGLQHKKRLCWVTQESAAVLAQEYDTRNDSVTVPGHGTLDLLIVFDGDAESIRNVLDQGRCTLISDHWFTFYLPFQPHIS
jgi:hypothetical protein